MPSNLATERWGQQIL